MTLEALCHGLNKEPLRIFQFAFVEKGLILGLGYIP